MRVSELCDIRIREVRLHAATGAHFRIPDAKTEAGVREVQVSPDLVDELVAHLDRLRRAGRPTEPDAYLFPNLRGGRMSRQRVARDRQRGGRAGDPNGSPRAACPPLPNTTPHTLRRTYISIALLANRFDVLWVMSQVGHADSKMTMDVYAQLQQRVDREHGRASTRSSGRPASRSTGGARRRRARLGHGLGHEAEIGALETAVSDEPLRARKRP